jgi:hypothetical protein
MNRPLGWQHAIEHHGMLGSQCNPLSAGCQQVACLAWDLNLEGFAATNLVIERESLRNILLPTQGYCLESIDELSEKVGLGGSSVSRGDGFIPGDAWVVYWAISSRTASCARARNHPSSVTTRDASPPCSSKICLARSMVSDTTWRMRRDAYRPAVATWRKKVMSRRNCQDAQPARCFRNYQILKHPMDQERHGGWQQCDSCLQVTRSYIDEH